MAKEKILIVDDEPDILELLSFNISKEGYSVVTALTGEEALNEVKADMPDLVLLDLMLPGSDGLEVCRRLKQNPKTQGIPIVMVTAKGEDSDIVAGLEVGADDYITKPFSPKIVVARVRAVLRRVRRRHEENASPKIRVHSIEIDTARHEVSVAGAAISLSVSEFGILEYLARNPGWVFSRNQIIAAVKGSDYPVTERSVDVQILGLRKKLGAEGAVVETVRGIGYRMREE
ncbi:MAG TPA: response regulator transcription factor [Spirochaetia bacterium]|nr:response regulator transcription factor [Spirochaetia bacterium]